MLKRLGIVLLVPLMIAAFVLWFVIGMVWAVVGMVPAILIWIITGRWHDPLCIWGMMDEPSL